MKGSSMRCGDAVGKRGKEWTGRRRTWSEKRITGDQKKPQQKGKSGMVPVETHPEKGQIDPDLIIFGGVLAKPNCHFEGYPQNS